MSERDADAVVRGWFGEHVATWQEFKSAEGLVVRKLAWAKPGTEICQGIYLYHGNVLTVFGALGEAVYTFHGGHLIDDPFRWVSRFNLTRFAGKCLASQHGRGFRSWSSMIALDALEDWRQRGREPEGPDRKKMLDDAGRTEVGSSQEWCAWLNDHGQDIFGTSWWEDWPGVGMVVDVLCRAQLVGIQMAIEQRDAKASAPAPAVA